MRSSLLLQEHTLQVLPSLAEALGLEQAIVVQQLHFLLQNPANGRVLEDGERYIFNTYEEWEEHFPWWSARTIQRIFLALKQSQYVITKQPEGSISRRNYYRLNLGAVEKLTYALLAEKKSERRKNVVERAKSGYSGSSEFGTLEGAKSGRSSYREDIAESTTDISCDATPRDKCMEAFASLETEDLSQVTDWGCYAKALKVVRAVSPDITPDDIRNRAANFTTWYDVPVTASALAKHWGRCAKRREITRGKPAEKLPRPIRPRRDGATPKEEFATWFLWKKYVEDCKAAGYEPEPMA